MIGLASIKPPCSGARSTDRSILSRAACSASVGRTAVGAPRSATADPPVSTRGLPAPGTLIRSTGTMALLTLRTVGVRLDLSESFPTRMSPKVMTVLFAFIEQISRVGPCDLLGRENGTLAANAQRAIDADNRAAQAGAHGTAHRLLHRDLQKRLATGGS